MPALLPYHSTFWTKPSPLAVVSNLHPLKSWLVVLIGRCPSSCWMRRSRRGRAAPAASCARSRGESRRFPSPTALRPSAVRMPPAPPAPASGAHTSSTPCIPAQPLLPMGVLWSWPQFDVGCMNRRCPAPRAQKLAQHEGPGIGVSVPRSTARTHTRGILASAGTMCDWTLQARATRGCCSALPASCCGGWPLSPSWPPSHTSSLMR